MIRPLAVLAASLLIIAGIGVHLAARAIVEAGHGHIAIVVMAVSIPLLSRYLDD
jgi:hypothetical protein